MSFFLYTLNVFLENSMHIHDFFKEKKLQLSEDEEVK